MYKLCIQCANFDIWRILAGQFTCVMGSLKIFSLGPLVLIWHCLQRLLATRTLAAMQSVTLVLTTSQLAVCLCRVLAGPEPMEQQHSSTETTAIYRPVNRIKLNPPFQPMHVKRDRDSLYSSYDNSRKYMLRLSAWNKQKTTQESGMSSSCNDDV